MGKEEQEFRATAELHQAQQGGRGFKDDPKCCSPRSAHQKAFPLPLIELPPIHSFATSP